MFPLIAGTCTAQTNVPLSNLPTVTTLGANDILPVVASGVTSKIGYSNMFNTYVIAYSNLVASLSNYQSVVNNTQIATNVVLQAQIANGYSVSSANLAALSNAAGLTATTKVWITPQIFADGSSVQGSNWSLTVDDNGSLLHKAGGEVRLVNGAFRIGGANAFYSAQEQGVNTNFNTQTFDTYRTNGATYLQNSINTLNTGPNFAWKFTNTDLSLVETTTPGVPLFTNFNASIGQYGDGRIMEFYGVPVVSVTNNPAQQITNAWPKYFQMRLGTNIISVPYTQ